LEFNVPFQHKYGYIKDELKNRSIFSKVRGKNRVALLPDTVYLSLLFLFFFCILIYSRLVR